jgi:heme/copper-type cytochrome/quinol oxidase subunit 3
MTLTRAGGLAALICAATYLFGFALLVTLLAPLGYGSNDIDPAGVLAFDAARPGILTAWNTIIYVVNALALVVLVVALSARQTAMTPGWAAVTRGLGLVWAALVLGAGMIANVALERAAHLSASDPSGLEPYP